jgi:hypothetical protein
MPDPYQVFDAPEAPVPAQRGGFLRPVLWLVHAA